MPRRANAAIGNTETPNVRATPGESAAIYVRISSDPTGRAAGVRRQREDCEALADRLGLVVIRVYSDNDVSAYNRRRKRPEYEAMLSDIEAGLVSTVIAWHPDRLHRRLADLERFVTLAETHHVEIRTVGAGDVDLSTASGRFAARVLGAASQHEIDHAIERMRRAKAQAAVEGRNRGGPRPFGWQRGKNAKRFMTLDQDEAQWIRRGCADVLAGRTLHAIAREWNEAGVATSTGGRWTYASVRTLLCRPRNAALVSHGRPDRPGLEIVAKAQWQAVVSEDVWRQVHRILTDPVRRMQQGNERRWLGSGLFRCGVEGCRGTLRVAPDSGYNARHPGTRRYLYRCVASAHLTMGVEEADRVVEAVLRARLSRVNVSKLAQPAPDGRVTALHVQRDALTARVAQFDEDYANGLIDARRLAAATSKVGRELDRVDERLALLTRRSPLASLAGTPRHVVASYDAAPLDVRRAVLDALAEVTVRPAGRGKQAMGADRIAFDWR